MKKQNEPTVIVTPTVSEDRIHAIKSLADAMLQLASALNKPAVSIVVQHCEFTAPLTINPEK